MHSAFRLAAAAVLVAGSGVAAQTPAPPPRPARTVKELVERAGRYVVDYGERISLVVGVERYTQSLRRAGTSPAEARTLVSEFALVRVADDWVGFRDVVEVDGTVIEDRRDRLVTLLVEEPAEGLLAIKLAEIRVAATAHGHIPAGQGPPR